MLITLCKSYAYFFVQLIHSAFFLIVPPIKIAIYSEIYAVLGNVSKFAVLYCTVLYRYEITYSTYLCA